VMLISGALLVGMSYYLWRRYVWQAFVPASPIVASIPATT